MNPAKDTANVVTVNGLTDGDGFTTKDVPFQYAGTVHAFASKKSTSTKMQDVVMFAEEDE